MKHKCNQYTIELLYNEPIIIKSSSHFNLQHWKREIKLNNKQEEKGRHLCLCRPASKGSQAKRACFSCVQHLSCLFAELFPRLEQEREWQVPKWILWFLLRRKKLVPAKEALKGTARSRTYFKYHFGESIFVFQSNFLWHCKIVSLSTTVLPGTRGRALSSINCCLKYLLCRAGSKCCPWTSTLLRDTELQTGILKHTSH